MARFFTALLAASALLAVASAGQRQHQDFPCTDDNSGITVTSFSQIDDSTYSAIFFAISNNGFPALSVQSSVISVGDYLNITQPSKPGRGGNDTLLVGKQIFSQLNSTDINWQFNLYSIIEYVANNTVTDANNVTTVVNDGFHAGRDVRVQEISLGRQGNNGPFGFGPGQNFFTGNNPLNFISSGPQPPQPVVYSPIAVSNATVNGVNVTVYTIQGNFPNGGNFKIIARLGDDPFTVNGNTIEAGNVKFDVEISNFPYLRNDSSLALRALIASRVSDLSIDNVNRTRSFTSTVSKGDFFGWNATVEADDGIADVTITNTSDWCPLSGKSFFYSFTGQNVSVYTWDPEIAVSTAAAAGSDATTVVASSFFVMSAAALASLMM